MAPSTPRKPIPRNDFPKYFSNLRTQTYTDSPNRNAASTVHRALSWNTSGTLLATGATDKTIRIWNPERTSGSTTSSTRAHTQPQAELKGHTNEVTKTVFNPVQEFELASTSKDGSVRFWDTRTKQCTTKLEVGGDLFSLAWSADGMGIVVGSKSEVLTVIDLRGNTTTSAVGADVNMFGNGESTNPSSTAGMLRTTPTIMEKHRQKLETNHTTFSNAVPAQDLLVTHGDGTVKILDFPSFTTLHTISSHTSSCSSIAYSPLGNYVAIGGSDAMIALWDTYDWVCRRTMSNANSGKVSGLSWSWDGRYITGSCEDAGSSGSGEGKSEGFEIYHAECGEVVFTVPTRTNSVPAVQWHPKMYALAYTEVVSGKSSLKVIGDVGGGS